MSQKRRLILILFVGLALRLPFLGWPGSEDMNAFELWGAAALRYGLINVYGLSDADTMTLTLLHLQGIRVHPPFKEVTELGNAIHIPDYPPGGILGMEISVGLCKFLQGGRLREGPALIACINLWPLFFSLCIALSAWFLFPEAGESRRLAVVAAFWLNPAVILASPLLGFVDPTYALTALLALLFFYRRQHIAGAVILALSCLIKPQPLVLIPIVLAAAFADGGWRLARRIFEVIVLCGLAALLPFVAAGRALAIFAGIWVGTFITQLSEQVLNVWWLAGPAVDAVHQGSWQPFAPIIHRYEQQFFLEIVGVPPGWVAGALLLVFTVFVMRFLVNELKSGNRMAIFWAGALEMYGVTMLSLQVHENHLFSFFAYALPLLLLSDRIWWKLYGGLSAFFMLNLYLFNGLGMGWNQYLGLRSCLRVVDFTIPVALANVAIFAVIVRSKRWLFDRTRPEASAAAPET